MALFSLFIAIVLNEHSCVSLHVADFQGLIEANKVLTKRCLTGISPGKVVRLYKDSFLDYPFEKMTQALDEYDCLRMCLMETDPPCKSINFFAASNECLLNNANSFNTSILDGDDSNPVSYMEIQQVKGKFWQPQIAIEKKKCKNSFHMIPWNEMVLRGEAQLLNVAGGHAKCLKMCNDCDYVVYNEYYSECFLIYYDHYGQKFNFITDDYQNAMCFISSQKEPYEKLVEKYCVGFEETNVGLLFEESSKCQKPKGSVIVVDSIELGDCMQLCLTHPTKSCEAVSYYPDRKCLLLSGADTNRDSNLNISLECRHYKLNAMKFTGISKKKGGIKQKLRLENELNRAKAHGVSSRKEENFKKNSFTQSGIDLNVETFCNYDSIVVKINAPVPVFGKVFPRNAYKNCSVAINGTKAELRMPLHTSECSLTKNGLVYENVIVVKQNSLSELPVITEYDHLYRISCDYTQHATKIAATSILQLRNTDYNTVAPPGKVRHSPMKMELASKLKKETKTVILGQSVDLKIEDTDNLIGTNFTVSKCVAKDAKGEDKITIIEDGCPTAAAREYIIRGSIEKGAKGFSIPLRAFRFKNGDGVKITCQLHACVEECVQRPCSRKTRKRRYLPHEPVSQENGEEVEISLIVNDETSPKEQFCVTRTGLISFSTIASFTLFLQFLVLLRLQHIQKTRKSL
ncbi:unnamed protein product [Cylicocyclus nassatus]|uniref:Uncharacterized protein n=1 Tax=Cylicocyclus nassatus TaxID=53992 RepID=A0AA36GEQ7_CYLNA|nr:unnamed protein product [Cylicocyclus nassatus]